MYLSDGVKKKKKILWLHIMLLAFHDSSICVQYLVSFWYVCDSFRQLLGLGFQTANQQTNTHMHSTSTSEYWNMSSKAERAYRSPYKKDAALSQSSISLHPTPILSFLSLICGENTYCSFFSWWNKNVQRKMKSVRGYDPRSLKRWYHTPYSQYIHM